MALVRLKAIELTCPTLEARSFMALVQSKAIELTLSTRVVREGNRPRLFDSGGTEFQALHGLGCNRRQSISSVRLG